MSALNAGARGDLVEPRLRPARRGPPGPEAAVRLEVERGRQVAAPSAARCRRSGRPARPRSRRSPRRSTPAGRAKWYAPSAQPDALRARAVDRVRDVGERRALGRLREHEACCRRPRPGASRSCPASWRRRAPFAYVAARRGAQRRDGRHQACRHVPIRPRVHVHTAHATCAHLRIETPHESRLDRWVVWKG